MIKTIQRARPCLALGFSLAVAASLFSACSGSDPAPSAPEPARLELLAGTTDAGGPGLVDGRGDAARFNRPNALALDAHGVLYVADTENHAIRRVSVDGVVSTLLADTRIGDNGEHLSEPRTLTVGPSGEVYFGVVREYMDGSPNWLIRAVGADGRARTVVDPTTPGSGADAGWLSATSIAAAPDGRIFIADGLGCAIRVFEPGRGLRTFAMANERPDGRVCVPTGAMHELIDTIRYGPGLMALDSLGNLHYTTNSSIVRIAADGSRSRRPAPAFFPLGGIAVDTAGVVYGLLGNQLVQVGVDSQVAVLAGSSAVGAADGSPAEARFNQPKAVARDALGRIYVSDWMNHSIRRIDTNGQMSTLAGRPVQDFLRDGPGAEARFGPHGALAAAPDGTLFMSDSQHQVVRRIGTDGSMSTWAGQPSQWGSADGPRGTARLGFVSGLLVEANGDLLLAESFALRRVKPDGSVETLGTPLPDVGILNSIHRLPDGSLLLEGSNGMLSNTGAPSSHWFDFFVRSPSGVDRHLFNSTQAGWNAQRASGRPSVAVSRDGRIFFAHQSAVYELTGTHRAQLLAGSSSEAGSLDGPGTAARFGEIGGLAIDGSGRLYVADTTNHLVRRVDRDGHVSTLLGRTGVAGIKTGPLPGGLDAPTELLVTPQGLVVHSKQALLRVRLD